MTEHSSIIANQTKRPCQLQHGKTSSGLIRSLTSGRRNDKLNVSRKDTEFLLNRVCVIEAILLSHRNSLNQTRNFDRRHAYYLRVNLNSRHCRFIVVIILKFCFLSRIISFVFLAAIKAKFVFFLAEIFNYDDY